VKPSLCLNMIVRNEGARIERALVSALPYVKAVAILDTGSTDDTVAVITRVCAEFDVPVMIGHGTFKDFSTARNDAYALAQMHRKHQSLPWCQFALMMDADMQLEVTDPKAFDLLLNASVTALNLWQTGGSVTYANTRIINLDWPKNPYRGVTHEYIDVPTNGVVEGARFIDHADGANRTDKLPRDIALLEQGLIDEPNNSRYMFYLGNTYKDSNRPDDAIRMYRQHIALGAWDEEAYFAQFMIAECERDMGDTDAYVASMLEAYNMRPRRAEPLHSLAMHFREKDKPHVALTFAKRALAIPRPNDFLFVNDFVYSHGARYEYSIAGFYDETERPGTFPITDALALDPACPENLRWSCKSNLFWHLEPLSRYCTSFAPKRLELPLPDGYTAMNPSVEECNGKILCNIRAVNYVMDDMGRYIIKNSGKTCHEDTIDTRNFLVKLGEDLRIKHRAEILWDRPEAKYDMVLGLEDMRLYRHKGDLCYIACAREQCVTGMPQQIRGRLVRDSANDTFVHTRDMEILTDEHSIEKNWMPIGTGHDFVYRLDRIRHQDGTETKKTSSRYVGEISGGSQAIPFKGGYMAVVHEASVNPNSGKRTYWHRFAWFTKEMEFKRLSIPFVFFDRQIEFCTGLCYHPNHKDLILSFGVRDAEAWVATVAVEEVARMTYKFHEN